MTLAPYPKYRPTGIEWLGEVPAHWEVKRLKYVARVHGGQSPPSADVNSDGVGIPFLQGNAEFGPFHPAATSGCVSPARTADPGDILLSVRAPVGALNVADKTYGIGRGLVAIRSDADTPFRDRFLFYYLLFARRRLHAVSTGSTYAAVSVSDVECLPVIHPGYEMQCQIVEYLDRETAKFDAVVRKQQTLIERLREKRSALITETVTRGLPPDAARAAGLDPHPPRKPSGVEWLGDLPAHWETRRLRDLASINDESLPDTTDPDFEMSYVDIGGVDAVKGIVESEPMTFGGAPSRARRIARDGDSIVSTVRTYLRAIAPVRGAPDDLIVSTGFAVVRPRALCPAYLSYAVRESRFVEAVVARSVGVSYPAVNASEIGRIVVPAPPDGEQQAIADYLDRETAKLDALVAKIEIAIERLREYRSALITAAVTGKVDVRSARRPAPAERGSPNRARRS